MYEIGQKVRIVSNTNGHDFEIGEIVLVKYLDDDGNVSECECLDGSDFWFLDERDIEPLEESEVG